MYRKYFGLNALPFKTTPDLQMFYKHGSRQEILEALLYTISRGDGILKITGEVGSGKTMLLRLLASRLPSNFEIIYINSPNLSAKDILLYICNELGIHIDHHPQKFLLTDAIKSKLVKLHSEGNNVVMLVDEAQAMTFDALEEIRLLSNIETDADKLLQIVLFGQPELDTALQNDKIRQLKSRITYSILVPPLSPSEVQAYLNHRMRKAGYSGLDFFDEKASKRIHKLTFGLPRNINVLTDKLLMAVFGSEDKVVQKKHFRNLPEVEIPSRPGSRFGVYISVIVLLLLISVLFFLFAFKSVTIVEDTRLVSGKEPAVNQNNSDIQNNITLAASSNNPPELNENAISAVAEVNEELNLSSISLDRSVVQSETVEVVPTKSPLYKIQDPLVLLNSEAKLIAVLSKHSEARQWLSKLQDRYVIQLSTRHLASLDSTSEFFTNNKIDASSVYILIDFNKNVKKFRLKVFYKTSSSFSELNQVIGELPDKIRRSHPYIASAKQLLENIRYTDNKLQEVGIFHETNTIN